MDASTQTAKAHISIHALLAESDVASCRAVQVIDISIHALLAESDRHCTGNYNGNHISIHALLAESDRLPTFRGSGRLHFYPRSPCGERLHLLIL